jgi:hypothetical protein
MGDNNAIMQSTCQYIDLDSLLSLKSDHPCIIQEMDISLPINKLDDLPITIVRY